MRDSLSLTFVDFDPTAGFSLPGAYGGTDFDNRGQSGNSANAQRTNRFLSYNVGLELQVGPVGVTVLGDFLNYSVGSTEGSPVSLTLGRIHAVAAYGFADNQVIVGAGARVIFVNVQDQSSKGTLVRMLGAAPQLGVIVKPNGVRWRIGTTARAPVSATPFALGTTDNPTTGVQQAGPFVLPRTITQPWELEAGIAYQLGPRPLNPVWIDPHAEESALEAAVLARRAERKALVEAELASMPAPTSDDERMAQALRRFTLGREELDAELREDQELADAKQHAKEVRKARYLNWPREHLLMLASVVLTGPSDQAVALEGFIDLAALRGGERAHSQPGSRPNRRLFRAVALQRRHASPALHVRRRSTALLVGHLRDPPRHHVAAQRVLRHRPALRELRLLDRALALTRAQPARETARR